MLNINRNIHKKDGRYYIEKSHNKKIYSFGSYPTIEDARYIRDHLEVINYGFNLQDDMRNISYVKKWGTYRVVKIIKGKCVFDRTYNSLKEAKKVRDFLISNNWDVSLLKDGRELPVSQVNKLKIKQLNCGKWLLKNDDKIIGGYSNISTALSERDKMRC